MYRGEVTHEGDFNPRSPYGERPGTSIRSLPAREFQSTLPIRGATMMPFASCRLVPISIHAPHTGSDLHDADGDEVLLISIHAPHTGSDLHDADGDEVLLISIHAPHTGSDWSSGAPRTRRSHFNPRSPYGERRGRAPPADPRADFNPRSPYGERLSSVLLFEEASVISIHAPHTGSDGRARAGEDPGHISIHAPHTGSDVAVVLGQLVCAISIHAPHTGSDCSTLYSCSPTSILQSTLPIRGATIVWMVSPVESLFQSTLPIRGATGLGGWRALYGCISIHAPHTGSDTPLRP